jgi:protease IV
MKKFLLGFVIGLVFAGLGAVIIGLAAVRLGDRRPNVTANSTLVLRLEGEMPEQQPVDVPLPFLEGQQPLTVPETWQLLKKAAADSRIKAVVIEPRGLSIGWAKLEELHSDLLAFKKSGKPLYAFLRGAGGHEYYLAAAADKIFMAPEDELDLKGLRAELVYVKGTLDKLGVSMEFEHVGKYTDAPDQFTKTGPSPETLEVTNQILDQYFGDLINVIAQGRNKNPAAVRALIDQGPYVAPGALAGGLVDELAYEDEMYQRLKDKLKIETKRVSGREYSRAPLAGSEGKSRVALITADGDITRGTSGDGVSSSGITDTGLIKTLHDVEEDSSIKGVILRIDSPGGDAFASDDILHAVKLLSAKKPMLISMSDYAASGGYFIAMSGDPVLAYSNTLTGSIGVFFGRVNLRGLYEKIGLKKEILARGHFAAIDSENGPLNEEERTKLRKEIEQFYHAFVDRVATGRKRPYDQVAPLAEGRVWLGAQAKQNGLVDEIGGLERALDLIKERAKIPASEKVTLVNYPPKRTLFEMLFNRGGDQSDAEAAFIERKVEALAGHFPLHALAQGGMLRLMPFHIEVK